MPEVIKFGDEPESSRWYVADFRPPLPSRTVRDSRFVDPWPEEWRRIEHSFDAWVGVDLVVAPPAPERSLYDPADRVRSLHDVETRPFVPPSYTLTFHGDWLPPEILAYLKPGGPRRFAFGIESGGGMARGTFPNLGGWTARHAVTSSTGRRKLALTVPVLVEHENDQFVLDIVGAGRATDLLDAP
jgi:hypothetical protein